MTLFSKKMTQSLSAVLLGSLVLTTAAHLQPRPAHAIVGVATGNPGALYISLFAFVFSGAAFCSIEDSINGPEGWETRIAIGAGTVFGTLGLVLLDGSSHATLKYSAISPAQAAKLGLTPAERTAFNQNLDELNAVAETVYTDLSGMKNPTQEQAQARWERYAAETELDATAFSTLKKISIALSQARK